MNIQKEQQVLDHSHVSHPAEGVVYASGDDQEALDDGGGVRVARSGGEAGSDGHGPHILGKLVGPQVPQRAHAVVPAKHP